MFIIENHVFAVDTLLNKLLTVYVYIIIPTPRITNIPIPFSYSYKNVKLSGDTIVLIINKFNK